LLRATAPWPSWISAGKRLNLPPGLFSSRAPFRFGLPRSDLFYMILLCCLSAFQGCVNSSLCVFQTCAMACSCPCFWPCPGLLL
jgi:hypothetical protein